MLTNNVGLNDFLLYISQPYKSYLPNCRTGRANFKRNCQNMQSTKPYIKGHKLRHSARHNFSHLFGIPTNFFTFEACMPKMKMFSMKPTS